VPEGAPVAVAHLVVAEVVEATLPALVAALVLLRPRMFFRISIVSLLLPS